MSKPSPRANVPKNNEVIRRRVHTPHERQSHVENDPDHGHEDDYAEPTYAQNKTSSDEFRSNLDGSSFGNAPCRSRLRPDLRLFVLHAAGGHERQSHSGDSNKRLHDLPRWENLSGHFLRLSESHSFCGGEKEETPLGARPGARLP